MKDQDTAPDLPCVLSLLPDEREAERVRTVLREAGAELLVCRDADDLCTHSDDRAGALLLAEESLTGELPGRLRTLLNAQESWSDLSLIILSTGSNCRSGAPPGLEGCENITLLQRPLDAMSLCSCVRLALRARRRQFEVRELVADRDSVLASINDSFIMVDRDWRFVYVNQQAAGMYGTPREDLIGQIIWEAVPDLDRDFHRRQLEACLQDGGELQIDYYHTPSRRWFEKRVYPSQRGLSIFATDITERKTAEENLRYQLGITQAITDNAADSLFLLDAEGCVTFMNPAAEQTFGWKRQELLGRALHDHVHAHRSRAAKVDCPLHSVFTSGLTLRDLEDEFRCKDGSRLYVSCSNAAIIIDGKVTGAVLVVHDITYHKLAEQQLKALNENLEMRVAERTAVAEQRAAQLGALASELTQTEQRERRRLAHILHDNLQQILVATKLQVGMIRQRTQDAASRDPLRHVEDLLTRSVEESRSLTVELSPPILYDAGLGRALEWLARRMQQEHALSVELRAEAEAEPRGDDIRAFLFQAVRESLFNIVKHARVKQARVTLTRAPGGEAVIRIEDDGVGFDLQTSAGKENGSGGFGLFSIRERLEFLGGRMNIRSAPGAGTRVELCVPIRDRERSASPEKADGQAASGPIRPGSSPPKETARSIIRVLLADDHKMLRDGLAGLLREQPDIEVVSEASDGQMAVELARQTQPDVIIMDITMPRMNGVEATRIIAEELPNIKVIGLSMHEKEDMAKAMRDAGAVNYITKGAPSEILTAAIRNCMLEENRAHSSVTTA